RRKLRAAPPAGVICYNRRANEHLGGIPGASNMTIQSRHSLGDVLDSMTAPGVLVETVDAEAKTVRCHACAHRCLIREGRRGICQVRFNRDGVLYVPRGYVASLQADPIEKKPFFHVLPGSDALSFG